jgi:hypothetical protein
MFQEFGTTCPSPHWRRYVDGLITSVTMKVPSQDVESFMHVVGLLDAPKDEVANI